MLAGSASTRISLRIGGTLLMGCSSALLIRLGRG